ncbi:DUF190 domain-containing protein [Georgenia alba]|uniref:DUF190 domain-containing protein n=1 Tax=Georgenia alba TaxID=2233858 RepID=A0ABW2Q7F9_9MICO
MTEPAQALRLTVLVGESDQWKHRPVYAEIVRRAQEAGLVGAAVFRGVDGYGALDRVHPSPVLGLDEDRPVSVVIVDTPAAVRAFLPRLDGLVTVGEAVLEEVEVIRTFGKRHRGGAAS